MIDLTVFFQQTVPTDLDDVPATGVGLVDISASAARGSGFDGGEETATRSEDDLLVLQRAASAAMVAAKELIAAAVEELSRRADAAARARAAADAHDAAVIAACVAKTASAFTLLNEAATMRMEWEASRPAESKAAWISPGHEETAAAMDARVRRGLQERAAADRRTANRASHDAAAAAENVAEAVERAATANTMVSYAQGLALGRIAFAVGTQVAVNEMERAAAAV